MTDKEIIKALECIEPTEFEKAPSVIMEFETAKEILDLIKRQQKRVEELESVKVIYASVDYCLEDYQQALEEIDKLKAEIESLESRIFALNDTNTILMETQKVYVNNMLKEFAERLETSFRDLATYDGIEVRLRINNLVKEMTEVKDDENN